MSTSPRLKLLACTVAAILGGALCVAIGARLGKSNPASGPESVHVPPFYEQAPKELTAVLDSKWFSDAETRQAYEAAARNRALLAQLPCYCYCDRAHGHKSLLSCFADDHGAGCSICKREAIFAAQEAAAGKSAPEIRKEIIQGLWRENTHSEMRMTHPMCTLKKRSART